MNPVLIIKVVTIITGITGLVVLVVQVLPGKNPEKLDFTKWAEMHLNLAKLLIFFSLLCLLLGFQPDIPGEAMLIAVIMTWLVVPIFLVELAPRKRDKR